MTAKILYVSPVWTNLATYSLSSNVESGMPAFTEPLKHFLNKGLDIDVLWIADSTSPSLKDPVLAAQSMARMCSSSKWGLIWSFFKIFFVTIVQIRKKRVDVVFCHGAASVGSIAAACLLRKRTVVRVYGTNKYASELKRLGKTRFLFKYPFVFFMFFLPSDSLIATNDGSGADEIFREIGSSRDFHFLKNGIPKVEVVNTPNGRDFLCVGRIERKKNQILALDFFNNIAKNNDVCLKFIGEISSAEYFLELKSAIQKSTFTERIEIVGAVDRSELCEYYKNCEAVVSFQENSNFGNVAIECLNFGCLFITYREELFLNLGRSLTSPVAVIGESIAKIADDFKNLGFERKQEIRAAGRYSIALELDIWSDRAERELYILLGERDV